MKSVLVLGTFDGVHKGHKELFARARQIGRELGMRPVILTFDRHPREVLFNEVRLLTLDSERIRMLKSVAGLDCRVINFTSELAGISPEEYIVYICRNFNAGGIIAGSNHTFGKDGAGGPADIVRLSGKYGYRVFIIPPVCEGNRRISSTLIRNLLLEGEADRASELLGYDYFIEGIVGRGESIGHTLGFPTANLEFSHKKLIPAPGVYVTSARAAGRVYHGMTNIGTRPTVSDSGIITIETYLFDVQPDLYGKDMRVSFIKRIRGEQKFASREELSAQLKQDELIARAYLSSRCIQ